MTRFRVYLERSRRLVECYEGLNIALPIEDHAFEGTAGPSQLVSGSFPDARSAEGTLTFSTPAKGWRSICIGTGTIAWTASVDTTAPALRLGGSERQSGGRRSLAVTIESPRETCAAIGRGMLEVVGAGATERFELVPARAEVFSGFKTTLRPRIPREARRAIRHAPREGGTVTADLTITARDAAGHAVSRKRTISLTG